MLNKKILIAALALSLCATAFASCGRNVDVDSGSSDTGSVTESTPKETESKEKETTSMGTEGTGTNGTTGSTGTTETSGIIGTETGESTGMGSGSDSTIIPDGGDIVGRIGNDVQNGMGNVKRGVQDFFDGESGMPHGNRAHRGRVPFGK